MITLWTVRLASLLYVLALSAWIRRRDHAARWAWTVGFVLYLAHVAAAFHFHHAWSHDAAYRETARQTAERFGTSSGAGLYFNYLFTVLWGIDVWRVWKRICWPSWMLRAVHGFLAFMFFNGVIVFGSFWMRWAGVVAVVVLAVGWWRAGRHPQGGVH